MKAGGAELLLIVEDRTGDRSDEAHHTQNRARTLAQFWVWWRMVQGGSSKRKPTTTRNRVFVLNFGGGDAGGSKRKSATPEIEHRCSISGVVGFPFAPATTTLEIEHGRSISGITVVILLLPPLPPRNRASVFDWNGRCAVYSYSKAARIYILIFK